MKSVLINENEEKNNCYYNCHSSQCHLEGDLKEKLKYLEIEKEIQKSLLHLSVSYIQEIHKGRQSNEHRIESRPEKNKVSNMSGIKVIAQKRRDISNILSRNKGKLLQQMAL